MRDDAALVRAGLALCQQLAPIVAAHEDAVLDALAADAGAARVATEGTARVREVHGGPLLVLAGSAAQRFYTLSPYVGCLIGCRFCYAQSRVAVGRALSGLPELRWGSYVDARVDAPAASITLGSTTPTHSAGGTVSVMEAAEPSATHPGRRTRAASSAPRPPATMKQATMAGAASGRCPSVCSTTRSHTSSEPRPPAPATTASTRARRRSGTAHPCMSARTDTGAAARRHRAAVACGVA